MLAQSLGRRQTQDVQQPAASPWTHSCRANPATPATLAHAILAPGPHRLANFGSTFAPHPPSASGPIELECPVKWLGENEADVQAQGDLRLKCSPSMSHKYGLAEILV